MNIVPSDIEEYAASHSFPEEPLLRELAEKTRGSTEAPQMLVGALEGAFLRLLVRLTQATRVLEIGTFTGYSALAMAGALPENGRLTTLDVDGVTTEIAKRFWSRSPHGGKIESRLGPALQSIPRLSGPFDLIFIDADKENYLLYWEACVPLLRSGGIIAVDNTLWSGRVLKPEDADDRAIHALNERARRDPRVETSLLTLRDGVLLGWKKP
jgi:caffeoyl-CoA O-methyltransferase